MGKEGEKKINLKTTGDFLKNSARITKMVWKDKKAGIIGLFLVYFGMAISPFLISGSRGLLIDELVIAGGGGISQNIALYLGLMIISTWLPSIFNNIQLYMEKLSYFYLEEKFEMKILEKRGEIDVAVHEDPKKNDLFSKIAEGGIYRAQNFFSRQFDILENIAGVIIASIVIFSFGWWVLILILIGALPELIVSMKYGKMTWGIHSAKAETKRKYYNFRNHFFGVSSLIELKLFKNINYFVSQIRTLFKEFQDEEKKAEKQRLRWKFFSMVFSALAIGFSVAYFAYQTANGIILVGMFTFVVSSVGSLRSSFLGLFSFLGKQYEDNLFVSDMFKFLDIKPAVKRPQKGITLDPSKVPEIIFENVSFSYPGTKKQVLKDFNLKISPGEKIAFVGVNGAGKTTFVKLLCRFYDPDKGRILIGGADLKDINLESWYEILGALFQDYSHYHFIVRDAIAIGRTGKKAKIKEVQKAAQAGEADVFIEEWEDRYNQILGKQFSSGIEPSIGQWQKLGLARTFYRDPRVLILDEPTSSIDAEAEAKIFEKLEKMPQERTVILISHRFSTVRKANRIAVIENGRLAELGTHQELLKANKTYAKLFKLQAKGYE